MNRFIEEQLNKVTIPIEKIADNKFLVRRQSKVTPSDFEVGYHYVIEVEDYIVHPFKGFNLHETWNGGVVPTDRKMHAEVTKVLDKMVCIKAVGVNDGKAWAGWLPKKSVKSKQVVL